MPKWIKRPQKTGHIRQKERYRLASHKRGQFCFLRSHTQALQSFSG